MSIQSELRKRFVADTQAVENPQVLVTAVLLPTGAIEVITNSMHLETKILYLLDAYDDEFQLRNNPAIRIVGYMLV